MTDWIEEGLPFACTGCGKCCTGGPGVVWVNDAEIESLATRLKITKTDFLAQYTRLVNGKRSLNEHPLNYDCVFLEGNRCQVYEDRPTQCRTFPWWTQNVQSKEAWEEAAKYCEGINPNAPKVTLKVIKETLHEYEYAKSRCRKERE